VSARTGRGLGRKLAIGAAVLGSWLCAGAALAARPVLAGEATYGMTGGGVLVHYATTGADAPPAADANTDGVPDYVEMVAQAAEEGLARFVAMGFRRPVSDGALGGDGRIDFYLINMSTGHAGTDSCAGNVCIGYAEAENDFAGASYGSLLEGVRSVVPHELFHLVQMAYASGQTTAWSEGSAVWAVEELYGTGNADFERFLPSFLTKSFRPFERPGGGFGDGYPYGAALWPYFLSRRHDPGVVVKAWEASATQPFLDACQTALAGRGSSVDNELTIMTRWNLFTGDRAAGGKYPDASRWPQVPKEMPITTGSGRVYVDGLSAAYVDVTFSGERQQLLVAPTGGIKVAAWVVAAGGGYDEGVELKSDAAGLVTTLNPGTYTLVVTGLTRMISATEVKVELRQAPPDPMTPDPDEQENDGGGCQSTPGPSGGWMIAFAIVSGLWRKRRRAAIST
jgi:MYXO-CTERM domain-containing protein